MDLENLNVKSLFTDDFKLTFLVGAGCSVDPPSCLPDAETMMESIINYTCAESEREKVLKLEDLRFETLLKIIRDQVDSNLKILDFYGYCDKPNIHHYFLAKMLRKGHIVITTNFDLLIEYALLQLNTKKRRIVPIITPDDFNQFKDPLRLLRKKKAVIYKVHGSIKNIFKPNDDTKKFLFKTLLKIGLNKEKFDLFRLEKYKKYSLPEAMNGRSLVIMGYSGNNDFDIIPTLKTIENIPNVIWFNHIEDGNSKERLIRFDPSLLNETDDLDYVDNLLLELSKTKSIDNIYRVDTNTTRLIKKIFSGAPNNNVDNFRTRPIDWFKKEIEEPDEFDKYVIPQIIYAYHNQCDDALQCFEKILPILEKLEGPDLRWKSLPLDKMGFICKEQKKYPEILDWFQKLSPEFEELQDHTIKATFLNFIGEIYLKQRNFDKPMEYFNESLEIFSKTDNLEGKAESLKNMGKYYHEKEKLDDALARYKNALEIINNSDFQQKKAEILHNQGLVYQDKGNYSKALKCFEDALDIFDIENNLERKINCLYNIGCNYFHEGNNPMAQDILKKTIKLTEQIDDLQNKIFCLRTKGFIYEKEWDLHKAIEEYKEALKEIDKVQKDEEKIKILNRIGWVYHTLKYNQDALEYFNDAQNITLRMPKTLPNLKIRANCLNNLGDVYFDEKDYGKALKWLEEALKIDREFSKIDKDFSKGKAQRLISIANIHREQGKDDIARNELKEALNCEIQDSERANILRIIGMIYQKEGDTFNALKRYDSAYYKFKDLDNEIGQASCLSSKAAVHRTTGNYLKALDFYKEALDIYDREEDSHGKAILLHNIGLIYHYQENFLKAKKYYESALKVYYKELGDLSGRISCQNKLGLLYFCQGKYEEAQEWYEQAMKLKELDILEIKEEKAKTNYYTALIYYKDEENIYRALNSFDTAFALFTELEKSAEVAECLNCIGITYLAQNNPSDALKKFEDALQIYRELENSAEEKSLWGKATCLNGEGIVNYTQRKPSDALKKFEDALQIYEGLKNPWGTAACLHNIGIIYHAQNKSSKAPKKSKKPKSIEIIEKAFKIYDDLEDLWGKTICSNHTGMIHQDLGNKREAKIAYRKASRIYAEMKPKRKIKTKTLEINKFIFYHGTMLEMEKEFKEERMSMTKYRVEKQKDNWEIKAPVQYA